MLSTPVHFPEKRVHNTVMLDFNSLCVFRSVPYWSQAQPFTSYLFQSCFTPLCWLIIYQQSPATSCHCIRDRPSVRSDHLPYYHTDIPCTDISSYHSDAATTATFFQSEAGYHSDAALTLHPLACSRRLILCLVQFVSFLYPLPLRCCINNHSAGMFSSSYNLPLSVLFLFQHIRFPLQYPLALWRWKENDITGLSSSPQSIALSIYIVLTSVTTLTVYQQSRRRLVLIVLY